MKSTKTKRYVVEKKFREWYTKIQPHSSSQRSTKLPFESGTSRAISAAAILFCLSFLVALSSSTGLYAPLIEKACKKETRVTIPSNQDQLSSNLCVGVCVGGVSAPLTMFLYKKNTRVLCKINVVPTKSSLLKFICG